MTSTEITTTPEKLVEIADRIRARTAQAVIETGRDLLKAKKLFAHGGFGAWLQSQVGIEPKMAQRYMQVARLADSLPKDKNDKLSFLPTSALYDLSAKSTSEPAREAVFEALEAGQRLNIKQVEYYLRRGERQAIEDKTDVHATAVEEPTAEVSIETALAEFGGTATSREHGLARVHKYEATTYRITTDGYRAARVECPDWPEGSDAAWADETGLEHHQVLALSSLWDAGRLMDASITSWAEAESIPPPRTKKPRKPTKAQLERQEQEAERAKERNEVCDILRKLPRDDLKRLWDLESRWMGWDFEQSAEWLFVLAEIDPDHDWLGEIELSNLNTEENRGRLEQIKAASRNDATHRAVLGAEVNQAVDDEDDGPDLPWKGRGS